MFSIPRVLSKDNALRPLSLVCLTRLLTGNVVITAYKATLYIGPYSSLVTRPTYQVNIQQFYLSIKALPMLETYGVFVSARCGRPNLG